MFYLNRIDNAVMKVYYWLLKNIPLKYYFSSIFFSDDLKKKLDILSLKNKKINNLIKILKGEKYSIYFWLRIYLYSCFILYGLCFIVSTVLVLLSIKLKVGKLLILTKYVSLVYKTWTMPIKKVRFIISDIYSLPVKIIKALTNFLDIIKNLKKKDEQESKNNPFKDNK